MNEVENKDLQQVAGGDEPDVLKTLEALAEAGVAT